MRAQLGPWRFAVPDLVEGFQVRDTILFIDARNIFTPIDRAHREFSDEQIQNIAIISQLHKGRREKFVSLVDRHFGAGMERLLESKTHIEPISAQLLEVLDDDAGKSAVGAIRVNPDVDPRTHVKTTTGKRLTKFGVDIERAERVFEQYAHLKHLRIAGVHCPEMGFEKDEAAVAALREGLRRAAPDAVYVALGSPKQEVMIERMRHELPAAWWMGVGISFSFICGTVKNDFQTV